MLPSLTHWIDPGSDRYHYSFKNKLNEVVALTPGMCWSELITILSIYHNRVGSQDDRRISVISSISRSTSTSGFLADKSSSN